MKKIIFLTGTRADFGKLKSLIKITQSSELFDVHIFVTGMHMISKYGKTINEIYILIKEKYNEDLDFGNIKKIESSFRKKVGIIKKDRKNKLKIINKKLPIRNSL